MEKITALTPAQWAAMAVHREEAYRIGSACGPTDQATTTAIIAQMYQTIGHPPPRMVFVQGPEEAAQYLGYLGQHCQRMDQLRIQLLIQLGGQLSDQLRSQVSPPIVDQLGTQIWDKLWHQLRGPLRGELWAVARNIYCIGFFLGSHEQYWIALYTFAQQIGVRYSAEATTTLGWWDTLSRSCGWWWPFEEGCVVADRPVEQHVDAQYRLHNETDPAMRYADGCTLWRWHGVAVDEQVICHPEHITLEHIQNERNAEVQRILIERFGWERYLETTQAVLLDSDVDVVGVGTLRGLFRTDVGQESQHVLVCSCDSTGKLFHLEVPPTIQTCREAAAWLAQDEDLHLLVQS